MNSRCCAAASASGSGISISQGGELLKLWGAGLVAAAVGTVIRLTVNASPVPLALIAVPANAITYLAITSWWDIPEAAVLTSRIRRALTGGVQLS